MLAQELADPLVADQPNVIVLCLLTLPPDFFNKAADVTRKSSRAWLTGTDPGMMERRGIRFETLRFLA